MTFASDSHDELEKVSWPERQRAVAQLRAEKEFSEKLLDLAPVIILLLDEDGNIRHFNPHLAKLTGYTAADMRNKNWFEHFIPAPDRILMQNFFPA